MLLSETQAFWFLPFVLPICVWVAWSDLATMKIPNKAVLALIAVFLVVGLIAFPFQVWLWQIPHFFVVLAIGFVLSIAGVMGAGDAKFAAAAAPFILLPDTTNIIAILGISALFGFISHRIARETPIRNLVPHWESWERKKDFPMGYPLALTLLVYLILAATGY
ncbi:MAG: prepilin peptidase [Litoreibacter sp.]|nr:prepilin peptidase [Litoreibacter sp.]MCY4336508.1 prepilin peptidase [Litoreibacter sp.]